MYPSKILVSIIHAIKQKGFHQNKTNSSLVFICNCKMGYSYLYDKETSINRELNLALNIVK